MNGRMMQLKAFLMDQAGRRFAWGRTDCALLVADWWRSVHGIDPAASLRGTYGTEDECHRLLAERGGLARLVGELLGAVGAQWTMNALPGDVGVVRRGARCWTGIAIGETWAIRGRSGLSFVRGLIVEGAWSL